MPVVVDVHRQFVCVVHACGAACGLEGLGGGGGRGRAGPVHGGGPTLRHVRLFRTSTRAAANVEALASDAADWQSFWQILAPYRTWNVYIGNYFGVAPLVLALWWITAFRIRSEATPTPNGGGTAADSSACARRESAIRQVSWWAFVLVVLTAVLAVGLRGKVYYVQTWLPIVGRLRTPFRYFILTQFGVAVLAAFAFAQLVILVKSGRKTPWRHLLLPWLAVLASLVLAAWDAGRADTFFPHRNLQQQFLAAPLFFAAAALGLTLATRGRSIGLFLLVLVTAVDLGLHTVGSPVGKIYWRKLPTYEQYLAEGPSSPPSHEGRIQDARDGGGWMALSNLHCLHGY